MKIDRSLVFVCLAATMAFLGCEKTPADSEIPGNSLGPVNAAESEATKSLNRLIAKYGGDVARTINDVPELEESLKQTQGKAIAAAEMWLNQHPPEKQKQLLVRLENILRLRKAVNEAAEKKENRVIELISTEAVLRDAAGVALRANGFDPDGKSDYEITSQLSDYQASAVLTAVARAFLESPAVKQEEMTKRLGLKLEKRILK